MVPLRQFLYLDNDLVTNYLEQLEGGYYDEEHLTTEATNDTNVGGEIGAAVARAHGGRKGSNRDELRRTMRQTDASRFARLFDLLQSKDDIQELAAMDDAIWEQLRRQECLDIQAVVSLPAFTRIMQFADQLPVMAALAAMTGQEIDRDMQEAVDGFQQLGQLGGARQVTIIAAIAGSPRYKLVAHLDREHLQVDDPASLEGEVNVFGVLQRKIAKGQTISLTGPITGLLGVLPPKQRKEAERSFMQDVGNDNELGPLSVRSPAAVLTPIAVYR